MNPKCSVLVTHVTILNILFSGQKTFDIENKDNMLYVYKYRTAKMWYVEGMNVHVYLYVSERNIRKEKGFLMMRLI